MATCDSNMRRYNQSENIYPVTERSQSSRIALLINNTDFYDPTLTRRGAQKDEGAMVNLLQTLGYHVEQYQNVTAQKIDEALKRFSRHRKLEFTDSVFVVLMSHGDTRTLWGNDHKRLDINKIYESLSGNNCPALRDKPKIFIIQASRGVYRERNLDMDLTGVSPLNPNAQVLMEEDFISLHCNAPHLNSYRHPSFSSFFIQSIIEVFNISGFRDHIDELFKKVIERFRSAGLEKKMPILEKCTLMKHFYLLPGKQQLVARQKHLHQKTASLRMEPAGVRWERTELKKYSFGLVIDMNTINKKLKLSENNKKVAYVTAVQPYPNHPDRFDRPQLLCRNEVAARGYWEVQWTGEVYIAVSYKGITRKGQGNENLFGWNNQSWSLYCSDGYTVWHNRKETVLSPSSQGSSKVGVYVDCHAGTLSFFRVFSNTLTHLHTFQTKFTEPVYPAFRVFTASSLHL